MAVFFVVSHNGAAAGSSIFPAAVRINLLEFGTGLRDRSSVDCPLIENAIRILIVKTVMPMAPGHELAACLARGTQLAVTTYCKERASPWLPLPTSVQPHLGTPGILPPRHLWRVDVTFTSPLDKAADTPADGPARKPCRNRGSTDGCRQATTRKKPMGYHPPRRPTRKVARQGGLLARIKVLHPQILDSPLDPFWLDWLPNRLDRSYVPCLSLSRKRKSWQYYAAEGRSRRKLGDSANANGWRLGWRKGPSRARRSPITGPGREPARHQVRRTVRSNACHGK